MSFLTLLLCTAAAEETLAAADGLRDEPPTSFNDRVFDNEINIAVTRTRAAYDRMLFREALKSGMWVAAGWARGWQGPWRFAAGACRPCSAANQPLTPWV